MYTSKIKGIKIKLNSSKMYKIIYKVTGGREPGCIIGSLGFIIIIIINQPYSRAVMFDCKVSICLIYI